ncbi:hypothetical protein FACS1894151_01180 [Spirochaetia bacterium]|nr:hypothetical protein FACS1894151_01180 [Spirochaetia bacterium]
MNKIAPNDITKVFSKIPNNIPVPDVTKTFDMLMEFKRENEATKRDIARLDVMKEVMITEITKKYDFYEKLFEKVFDERKIAIQKFFEIIDNGIKQNDKDLVLSGLSNLSNVVASSPFANIGELKNLIEQNKQIEM